MRPKHIFYVFVVISSYQCVSGIDIQAINYCGFSNNGLCVNKTHLLCNFHPTRRYIDQEFRAAILDPINKLRADLGTFLEICNLYNLEWSQILESLAEGAVSQEHFEDYCLVNNAYKNVLYFNLTNINNNSEISSKIVDKMTSNPNDKPKWLYSSYSTGIGCAINNTRKYVVCMINGFDLVNMEQSLGYKDECTVKLTTFEKTLCKDELICENHIVCQPLQDFNDAYYEKMAITTKKFILHKLINQTKVMNWNNDLEYLAQQIVTQKLSMNDKCLAIKNHPNVASYRFEGTDIWHDLSSNIDNMMWQSNEIRQNVGCVLYKQKTEHLWNSQPNTHIYCLYEPDHSVVTMWPMILIMGAVITVVCGVFIIYVIRIYRKPSEITCEPETVDKNPSDYIDQIDVR